MSTKAKATMRRRQFFLPDPLWVRLEAAAEQQSQAEGRAVSVSELIRAAIVLLLDAG